jgi:hypothetical protein
VFLVYFNGFQRAGKVRRSLGERIKAGDGDVLSTTVLRVDPKGKAKIQSPRSDPGWNRDALRYLGVFGVLASGIHHAIHGP